MRWAMVCLPRYPWLLQPASFGVEKTGLCNYLLGFSANMRWDLDHRPTSSCAFEAATSPSSHTSSRTFAKTLNGHKIPNLTSPLEQPYLTNDPDPLGEPSDWHQATHSSGSSYATRNLPLPEPEPTKLDEPFASLSPNANLVMSRIPRYSTSATSSSGKPSPVPNAYHVAAPGAISE
jgi:hypothetical protein